MQNIGLLCRALLLFWWIIKNVGSRLKVLGNRINKQTSTYTQSTCSTIYIWTVCCSVLQCVAVCCSVPQFVAVFCSVLQCVAVCCSVLQCVAVCCSVLQCDAVWSWQYICLCMYVCIYIYTYIYIYVYIYNSIYDIVVRIRITMSYIEFHVIRISNIASQCHTTLWYVWHCDMIYLIRHCTYDIVICVWHCDAIFDIRMTCHSIYWPHVIHIYEYIYIHIYTHTLSCHMHNKCSMTIVLSCYYLVYAWHDNVCVYIYVCIYIQIYV